MKLKIKKGDKVEVTGGKYKGKQGLVEKVIHQDHKIVVAGVNMIKKHVKPRGPQKPGGIIDIAKPIDVAKVMVLCPNCQSKTRLGYEIKGNEKHRICRKCGGLIK